METLNAEVKEILNDLVAINNDRIVGYERAMKELSDEDADLKPLFLSMIDESREAKMELVTELQVYKGEADEGTTASGKIYRAWMDVKALFTGHDRHTVLANCEYGEDAAQKAYTSAQESEHLPAYLRDMIYDQQQMLKASHNEIKAFRDNEVHA